MSFEVEILRTSKYSFRRSHHSNSVRPPLSTVVVDRFVPLCLGEHVNVKVFRALHPSLGCKPTHHKKQVQTTANQTKGNEQTRGFPSE